MKTLVEDDEELRRLNEEAQAAGESVARAVSAVSLFFRVAASAASECEGGTSITSDA